VKRYKFRLAQVQKVRTIELDRAVGEVARARHALVAAQDRAAALEQLYLALPRQPEGTTTADLRAHLLMLQRAADGVVRSRQAIVEQQHVVQARMAEWAEADRKVRLLDQLDERSRARHTEEVLAEEQQVLDDVVTSRRAQAA
jgi:flagellar export protein FliJ